MKIEMNETVTVKKIYSSDEVEIISGELVSSTTTASKYPNANETECNYYKGVWMQVPAFVIKTKLKIEIVPLSGYGFHTEIKIEKTINPTS